MSESIPSQISLFLEENGDSFLSDYIQFICLEDGTLFYHNGVTTAEMAHQLSALSCGAWRASYFMARSINEESKEDLCTLSFGSTSDGLYLLTLNGHDKKLYAGISFQGEVNPAVIKQKFKIQTKQLELYFNANPIISPKSNNPFEGLTEDEINEAFQFEGGK